MRLVFFIILLLFNSKLLCQYILNGTKILIKSADSLAIGGNLRASANKYHQAFLASECKMLSAEYKASYYWAHEKVIDSAFLGLNNLIDHRCFLIKKGFESETEFAKLKEDARWVNLKKRLAQANTNANCVLSSFIDSLAEEERKNRSFITDKKNYRLLRQIIDNYGFPDFDLVGEFASINFAALVQHQDFHVNFQDSVLNLLGKAYLKGKASGISFAYLTDRVKCNKGELQIFGTQVNWDEKQENCKPKPVLEPEGLDDRRKKVGLEPEEKYLEYMYKRHQKKIVTQTD